MVVGRTARGGGMMGGGSFLGGRSACEDSAALAVGAEPIFGCLGLREVAEVVPFFLVFLY